MIRQPVSDFCTQTTIINFNDILSQFGSALIGSMFIANIMFLILCIWATQISLNWNLPSWIEIIKTNPEDRDENFNTNLGLKSFSAFGWVCLPVSAGFALMLIAYKIGWNI